MPTLLSQALHDMYRQTIGTADVMTGSIYDGLVSELQADDYLVGSRQVVVSTGATTGGIRELTLRSVNGVTATVNWVAASSIRFKRG